VARGHVATVWSSTCWHSDLSLRALFPLEVHIGFGIISIDSSMSVVPRAMFEHARGDSDLFRDENSPLSLKFLYLRAVLGILVHERVIRVALFGATIES
jgi:hypothetical protein